MSCLVFYICHILLERICLQDNVLFYARKSRRIDKLCSVAEHFAVCNGWFQSKESIENSNTRIERSFSIVQQTVTLVLSDK